jgi:NAD(P)H-flavin reductase
VLDSPPLSLPCYIVSVQRVGAGCGKVLIPNPDYKGNGHTESALSNLTLRVQRRRPLPKICGPPGMMEFTDNNMEEEKEEFSNELVATLKQKITALEEKVAMLHLAVYDQHDDFDVLRKAIMSKLKRFAKALDDPSFYNAPSP